MFTDSFRRVLSDSKGWTPVLFYIAGSFVAALPIVIMNLMMTLVQDPGGEIRESVALLVVLLLLLWVPLFLALLPLLWGGLVGSLRRALEGENINLAVFWQDGKRLYWRTVGYGLLYGASAFGVALLLMGLALALVLPVINPPDALTIADATWMFLVFLANYLVIVLITWAVFLPLGTLSIAGYETQGFVHRHWKGLAGHSFLMLFLSLIPIANLLAQPLYLLYVESLAYEDEATMAFVAPSPNA